MVNERSLCNPSHPFLKEFNLSNLSTSSNDDGMEKPVACLALEAIMKDQVESESQQQQWVSTKKPRRNEKCEIVCKDPGGGTPI